MSHEYYPALKEVADKIKGGTVTVLAARPGMGKSFTAIDLAIELFTRTKRKTLYLCENSAELISRHMLCPTDMIVFAEIDLLLGSVTNNLALLDEYGVIILDELANYSAAECKIVYELREIATNHQIAVIVLAGVSREIEARKDRRPAPDDIYHAKTLLPLFDLVITLYKDSYYTINGGSDVIQMFIRERTT